MGRALGLEQVSLGVGLLARPAVVGYREISGHGELTIPHDGTMVEL